MGRRIKRRSHIGCMLIAADGAHTFLYDGWNVVLELVEHDGVTDRIEYYWGKDISGTLDGAAGIGGLIAIGDV